MAKNSERRRTMVYSNVNKKAEQKSAFENNDVINLDNEIVIGLTKKPEQKNKKVKKSKQKKKKNVGNNDLKILWENEKAELKREEKIAKKNNSKKNNVKKQKSENGIDDEEIDILQTKSNNSKQNKKTTAIKPQNDEIIINAKIKSKKVNQNNNQVESKNKKVMTGNNKNNIQPKIKSGNVQKQQTIQDRIRKQKIRVVKKIMGLAILIVLLVGGLVCFLLSPVFNVKKIDVINNSHITTEEIVRLSGINKNENIFKFSKTEAKKSISSNPYIEDVQVKRKLFNSVEIDVKERTTTLMLEYGNSYVYINNQGYILDISTEKLEIPMLTNYITSLDQIKPGNRLGKEDLERLATVLSIIEVANSNGIGNLITKIDIKSKRDYIVTMESEDKIVHLGECTDLSTQMLFVKKMIEREKGIEGDFFVNMDLNVNKPVFREKV